MQARKKAATPASVGHEKRRTSQRQLKLWEFVAKNRLNLLLLFVPVSIAIELLGYPKLWVFVTSAIAIVPLAGLIGQATEQLSHRVGPGLGGLLNATFGNATELIIAVFALQAGLHEVVKASISGSIIGNILLVLGASMLAGGWGRNKQTFSRTGAAASSAMLFLAVVSLVMPAVFDLTVYGNLRTTDTVVAQLSLLVSVVLLLTYAASLVFALRTHRELFSSGSDEEAEAQLNPTRATALLLIATVVVALEAEFLVGAINETTEALGMSTFFVGVIVVAVVGNAAEHASAVTMAMKDRMELAVSIATNSSTQIALFVAPVLVLLSFLFGNPMSLVFNGFEIAGVTLSVLALSVVSQDGESNWFEGLQLIAVYLVLAIVFFFVPSA